MVLLPLVCSRVDVPVIAASGITDGRSMAAAFALGADALRTAKTTDYERVPPADILAEFRDPLPLYFGGDMEAAIALCGQVAGRIDTVEPVGTIIDDTMREFRATLADLGTRYGA